MIGSLPTRAREAAVGCIKRGVVEIGIARFGEMPMNGFSWRCALREGGVWSDILDLKSGRPDLPYPLISETAIPPYFEPAGGRGDAAPAPRRARGHHKSGYITVHETRQLTRR